MRAYSDEGAVNIRWGQDVTIRELAEMIAQVIGFSGDLAFDTGKPDGTRRKLLDTGRVTELGWRPCITLRGGGETISGFMPA